jgi:hypothetical protein
LIDAPEPAFALARGDIVDTYVWRRLFHPGKFRKVFVERLTEPLHLNLASLFVAIFGSYRMKVDFDLAVRQQYAFPLLYAAETAKRYGIPRVTALEFGVANGAGLMNMCRLAERTRRAVGVDFRIIGFDTGVGMPPAIDYRDLPDTYQQGDFPMMDAQRLRKSLPSFAELFIGDVKDTVPQFLPTVSADAPIGFVSVDVDYYSAREVLKVLTGRPDQYLPIISVFLDDITADSINPWTGELLAVNEFNLEHEHRKIAPFTLLRSKRIFKNAQWIDRMYAGHIHDHRLRSPAFQRATKDVIPNEYL